LFFSGKIDSEGSQVESLSRNLCQIDFGLCQDHQLPFACKHKIGRGGVQEYFSEKRSFGVPNLASGRTHGTSVVNNYMVGTKKRTNMNSIAVTRPNVPLLINLDAIRYASVRIRKNSPICERLSSRVDIIRVAEKANLENPRKSTVDVDR
jgi:hypothetical protein